MGGYQIRIRGCTYRTGELQSTGRQSQTLGATRFEFGDGFTCSEEAIYRIIIDSTQAVFRDISIVF